MTESQLKLGGSPPSDFPETILPADLLAQFADFDQEEIHLLGKSIETAKVMMSATAQWISYIRDLRNKLQARNGSGNNGWHRVCRVVYHLEPTNAASMIKGWERRFLPKGGNPGDRPLLVGDPSPTFYRELGKVPDEVLDELLDEIRNGSTQATGRAIIRRSKALKTEAHKVKIKASAPPKAPSAPKLPTRQNSGLGQGMSVSKWTAADTPQGDRMDAELNYLAGSEVSNASFVDALKKVRKSSSRSGKLSRIQTLAEALHAECKAVSDRYQLENEKARDWKRYMTVWQHHWSDTDQLDMAESLKQIASEMAEASRHFEIMGQLSWSDKVRLEE